MARSKANSTDDNGGKRFSLRDLIRLIGLALLVTAIIKELRKPAAERTWNGTLLDLVPYDFRKPTMEKARSRVWNPDGPLISPQVFGVGWTVNVGAVVARVKSLAASSS